MNWKEAQVSKPWQVNERKRGKFSKPCLALHRSRVCNKTRMMKGYGGRETMSGLARRRKWHVPRTYRPRTAETAQLKPTHVEHVKSVLHTAAQGGMAFKNSLKHCR